MRKGRVREILEMMTWKPGEDPSEYVITFISRGAPGDLEVIRGNEAEFRGDRIILSDGRVIPLHRIVEIRRKGVPLYRKTDW